MRAAQAKADLQIGDLARQTSVNIETIRYYERVGLIPRPARARGGWRIYDGEHAQRLSFIRRARELGFSLSQVRELLRLADDGSIDCCAVRELTVHHLSEIRGKIASLRRLERALKTMTETCKPGRQRSCPIFDALTGSA